MSVEEVVPFVRMRREGLESELDRVKTKAALFVGSIFGGGVLIVCGLIVFGASYSSFGCVLLTVTFGQLGIWGGFMGCVFKSSSLNTHTAAVEQLVAALEGRDYDEAKRLTAEAMETVTQAAQAVAPAANAEAHARTAATTCNSSN